MYNAYSTYPLPITYMCMYMYKILSMLRPCGVKVYYNLGQSGLKLQSICCSVFR